MKHPKSLSRLDGKLCVITGASDGIGVETARFLASQGARLVLPVRNRAKAEPVREDLVQTTGNKDITLRDLDLGSLASVRSFTRAFLDEHKALDLLVLNAGLSATRRSLTQDGFESTFGVNHFGHFVLTLELLGALRAAERARVVVVASKLHTSGTIPFDDLTYEKGSFGLMQGAYPDSKLANVLFSNALARRLKGTKVTVNSLHPGVVSTSLAREMNPVFRWAARTFFMTPEKGAHTSVYVAASPDLEGVTGRYFDSCKEVPASPKALDEALQERLWERTETLTGTRFTA
ncbi:MAG: SDR family oxidoreductase [Deltaproteobacteria bacterium]|nr:SDR family oxidoreductase [Deltaproteobacteria bacterium]